jgi:hypothetical protein
VAAVYDLEATVPGGFDATFAFDVIEHVDDPWAFLHEMEQRADVVMVNLLENDGHDVWMHRDLPIDEILAHARSCGLLHYQRYHDGRSHLVAYRSPSVGGSNPKVALQGLTVDGGPAFEVG